MQEAPAARVAALDDGVSCGQVELPPMVKPDAIVGFRSEVGTGKVSVALPLLVTVTVCGLSELVEPTAVVAKLSAGGSAKSSFSTKLLLVPVKNTLALASSAMSAGPPALLSSVLTVV